VWAAAQSRAKILTLQKTVNKMRRRLCLRSCELS